VARTDLGRFAPVESEMVRATNPCHPHRVFTADMRATGSHEQRTMTMTALQDWLSFRPVDQSAIKEMVFWPLRAVLSTPEAAESTELKVLQPGLERC
jgi:hypothetical protein